jgi:hypothetical protein
MVIFACELIPADPVVDSATQSRPRGRFCHGATKIAVGAPIRDQLTDKYHHGKTRKFKNNKRRQIF